MWLRTLDPRQHLGALPPRVPFAMRHSRAMNLPYSTSRGSNGKRRLSTMSESGVSWTDTMNMDGLRGSIRKLLYSTGVGYLVCVVACLDSGLIGLEQSTRLERGDTNIFNYLEASFVAFYSLELVLVFYAFGRNALSSQWVRLDCVLVACGMLTQLMTVVQIGDDFATSMLVLRVTRMLRLSRALRVLVRFRELWMLCHGFINSLKMLSQTMLLGFVIIYVYGCVAMEMIPLNDNVGLTDELKDNIKNNFRTLPVTMLTLIQFATFDSPSSVYKPWLDAYPTMGWFFISALLVMGVVFMNLVTAVIVNRALESAREDEDMQKAMMDKKRKNLLQKLEMVFEEADTNCSGELSREELEAISHDQKALFGSILGNSDLLKLFDYLDVDGDGSIGIGEFCAGIEGLVHSDTRLEIKRMERMLESMRKQFVRSVSSIDKTVSNVASAMHLPTTLENAASRTESVFEARWDSSNNGSFPLERLVSARLQTTPREVSELGGSVSVPAWANEILEQLRGLGAKMEDALSAKLDMAQAKSVSESPTICSSGEPEGCMRKISTRATSDLPKVVEECPDSLLSSGEWASSDGLSEEDPNTPPGEQARPDGQYSASGPMDNRGHNDAGLPVQPDVKQDEENAGPVLVPRSLPPILLPISERGGGVKARQGAGHGSDRAGYGP